MSRDPEFRLPAGDLPAYQPISPPPFRKDSIPSCLTRGKLVVDEVLDRLRAAAWQEEEIFGVHLALEEAVVNAIKHGNKFCEQKSVHVTWHVDGCRFVAHIQDEGAGFRPEEVPDCTLDENLEVPSGRGIMLMRSFMCRVEYSPAGNEVFLEKRRSAQ